MDAIARALMPHLIVAPIVLPLLTAALMLLLSNAGRWTAAALNVAACVLGVLLAITLLHWVHHTARPLSVGVYLPSNWAMPYGIVLAADRLAAMMVLLASLIALAAVLYSCARWHQAGAYFHPLFQLQLMGLYGAFLTADLFNLFVFFEIMLTASYGLLLHGTGWPRVRASVHYIALNLMASSLFLIGAAMLYGVTGTLSMADMAIMVPAIPENDRALLHAGAAILAVAFLVKAAAWPLNFWLPPAYSSAAAPVAALFALMTKLGVYAILRLWTLLFPQDAGISALFGGAVLVALGLVTLAFGALGVLASQHLGRMAAFCAIFSSGALLAALGFGRPAVTGGALYYTFGSTMAVSTLFLLVELINRTREVEDKPPLEWWEQSVDAFAISAFFEHQPQHQRGVNLDDDEQALIGRAIPGSMAFLGLAFMACVLTIAGLPPMPGFVGKMVMLSALLNPAGFGQDAPVSVSAWALLALLMLGGLLSIIAMSRAGIRYFWAPAERPAPRLHIIEVVPVAMLLALCCVLVWRADEVMRYVNAAARNLHAPGDYISAVAAARPVPPPQSKASEAGSTTDTAAAHERNTP